MRILGILHCPCPPPLSWSESTSSTLTAGRRLRLELSGGVKEHRISINKESNCVTNGDAEQYCKDQSTKQCG